MATEITCVLRIGGEAEGLIDDGGGLGWTHEATAIGEIEAGRRYFVKIGAAHVNVVLIERHGRRHLRTDPDESADNTLLSLPTCPFEPPALRPR